MRTMVRWPRLGKNLSRKIFGILLVMTIMSVFLKFSLIGHGVEVNRKSMENGQVDFGGLSFGTKGCDRKRGFHAQKGT